MPVAPGLTNVIPTRNLGQLPVGALGLGCMGMTGFYGPTDDAESSRTLRHALDAGITLFDTADRYGLGRNEELVGKALAGTDALIATKFGIVQGQKPGVRLLDGSPDYVRRACEASLLRLGRSSIDLYLLHRVDKKVPIEETVGAMGRLVAEGKVRHIGLCEVGAATLRRAHATFPISAVQSEYSLWCREPEGEVLEVCRELGVGFMAYWALGIGMLTARFNSPADFSPGDFRPSTPRFQPEHFERNIQLVTRLRGIADRVGCTPAQLSLAWLLARAPFVVPLVGTKKTAHLDENLGAVSVSLDRSVVEELEQVFPRGAGSGERYPPEGMSWLNG